MSRVAVIGAHGKVGQHLLSALYDDGHEAVGVIRNPDHVEDVFRLGGEAVVFDLEKGSAEELAAQFDGVDAVVFTAGAGAGSGTARKDTVDRNGSVVAAAAAEIAGIRRFIQVSAIGVDEELPEGTDETWAAYVIAKRDADAALRGTGLDWTIVRPGALTTDEGTGEVALAEHTERGEISRADVAHTIVALLDAPRTVRRSFDLVGGSTPIAEAVAAL